MSKATFIEPMLLLRTESLPEGADWVHELQFDEYRALAIKLGGKVHLRSRNDKEFNGRYPAIVKALAAIPDDTVTDGEIVDPLKLSREVGHRRSSYRGPLGKRAAPRTNLPFEPTHRN